MPSSHGSPWPGSTVWAPVSASTPSDSAARSGSAVCGPCTTWGPVRPRGPRATSSVTSASPVKRSERSSTNSAQLPGGVDYARGPGYVDDLSVREVIELSHRRRPEDSPRDVARHVERVPGPPYVAHHASVA